MRVFLWLTSRLLLILSLLLSLSSVYLLLLLLFIIGIEVVIWASKKFTSFVDPDEYRKHEKYDPDDLYNL